MILKHRRCRPTLMAAAALLPLTAIAPRAQQPAEAVHDVAGERIVGLAEIAQREGVVAAIQARGHRVVAEVRDVGLLLVKVAAGTDEGLSSTELRQTAGVAFVERNGIGEGGTVPGDTFFSSQWQLDNTGQSGGNPGADIEAVAAWALQAGKPEVVVAVLDTGIDFTHPEFSGRTLPGFDFVNEDPDPTADHPHGIYVTGLLAANANNGFQVAGVDHNCTVLPVKVLDNVNRGATFDLIQGLVYAADQGADVISMSLINYRASESLSAALRYAAHAGCILVACAGNGGLGNADVSWPGASPLTISIGASDDRDQRASYSGTGQALDFIAPGDQVITAANSPVINLFHSFSGCSGATPVAAGIVSLLHAQFPLLDQDQAYALLREGAEDMVGRPSEDTAGRDPFHGHGRVNAARSLSAIGLRVLQLTPGAGETVHIDVIGGRPAAPAGVVITRIGNQQGLWLLQQGLFDAASQFTLSFAVPPGHAGLEIDVIGAGIHALGQLAISRTETLRLQ